MGVERIEHLLSPETSKQILGLVQFLLSDDAAARALLKKLKAKLSHERGVSAGSPGSAPVRATAKK